MHISHFYKNLDIYYKSYKNILYENAYINDMCYLCFIISRACDLLLSESYCVGEECLCLLSLSLLLSIALDLASGERQAGAQRGGNCESLACLGLDHEKAWLLGGLCYLLWAALLCLFWEQWRLKTQHGTCMTIYFERGYKYVSPLEKKSELFE